MSVTKLARCVAEYLQHALVHVVLDDTCGTLVSMPGCQYAKRRDEIKGRVFLSLVQAEAYAAKMAAEARGRS